MSRRRHSRILRRRRIFVGCEGESERGYVALLRRLLEERHGRFHLETIVLGGGDPLAIVQTAERQLRQRTRRDGPYAAHVVFLDADRRALAQERVRRAEQLAAKLAITLVWQEPCHEALLLRHLPDCAQLRPPTADAALAELRRRWDGYEKAMPAIQLLARLNREAVLQAAGVEPGLRAFLAAVEFDREEAV